MAGVFAQVTPDTSHFDVASAPMAWSVPPAHTYSVPSAATTIPDGGPATSAVHPLVDAVGPGPPACETRVGHRASIGHGDPGWSPAMSPHSVSGAEVSA